MTHICHFCRRELSDKALMWTMVYGKLVPCHRNCEKVWFFNKYGNQTGGCYSLPDRLSGFDRDSKGGSMIKIRNIKNLIMLPFYAFWMG